MYKFRYQISTIFHFLNMLSLCLFFAMSVFSVPIAIVLVAYHIMVVLCSFVTGTVHSSTSMLRT